MKKTALFSLLIFSLILISCEKEVKKEIKPKPSFSLNYDIDSLLQGSAIGSLHNQYLDYVTQISSFPNHSLQDLFTLTVNIDQNFFNNNLYVSAGITSENLISETVELATNSENLGGVAEYLFQEGKISEMIKNYLLDLDELVENGLDYFIAEDLDGYLNSIMNFIIEIKNAQNIEEQELVLLLGCAEIAYYSGIYWFNVMMDDNNPWFLPVYIEHAIAPEPKDKWWKKPVRLGLDVAGFALGWAAGYFPVVDIIKSGSEPTAPEKAIGGSAGVALGSIVAKETSSWIN